MYNNANHLAALCVEESEMGRVDDKIAKIILAAKKTPGTGGFNTLANW